MVGGRLFLGHFVCTAGSHSSHEGTSIHAQIPTFFGGMVWAVGTRDVLFRHDADIAINLVFLLLYSDKSYIVSLTVTWFIGTVVDQLEYSLKVWGIWGAWVA